MIGHLWAKGPAPKELITLVLCRDVYHCLPSALAKEDPQTIWKHLIVMDGEHEVAEMEKKRHKK